jgi:hypothetical protein
MLVARAAHTATTLPDGRVLVAGGCSLDGCGGADEAARAELFDPRAGRFVAGPVMTQPRVGHTATALVDGRVLLVGGWPAEGVPPTASAEIYDPTLGTFAATGSMAVRRGGHSATRLPDGRVLVVGDTDSSTVEVYDPRTGRFSVAAPLPGPRSTHAATLLADGRVLVAGGQDRAGLLATAVLYDPRLDSWRDAGPLPAPTYKLALAALPDGGALAVGGQTSDDRAARLATTAVFDPRSGRFVVGPTMAEPRFKISDAVVPLPGGRLAVAGGFGVDIFAAGVFARAATGVVERQFPAAAALPDGRLLVTGGYDNHTRVTGTTMLFHP